MKINRKTYLDKVHSCWVGKNIGGTMGVPYEWETEMVNCTGFTSPKGMPLPNDDLDLQLIWLLAIEDYGIRHVTPQVLGEYWIDWITGPWNEYGISKANMKVGLLPPYCGEYANHKWRNSNGAWIRTEIWACLFPGYPELAVRCAYKDACVDHGLGEGTMAAMFVAAIESAAFFEKNIRKLINDALHFIPADCRLAKSVQKAVELYEAGTDFKDARNAIVEMNRDLGWFQAPGNVSFAVLGLLYGEGDFKKTMLHAINCGDDTDCTGATVGSILGIMYGSECIPADWADYIGDDIKSCAIDMSADYRLPKTCTDLTRRIYELLPSCFKAYNLFCEYTDGETELEPLYNEKGSPRYFVSDFDMPRTGFSMNFADLYYAKARVEFDKCSVGANESITLRFVFQNISRGAKQIKIHIGLPDGWTADKTSTCLCLQGRIDEWKEEAEITITANERPEAKNTIYAYISAEGRISSAILPIVIWNK